MKTIDEATTLLNVSKVTIYNWIKWGWVKPTMKYGKTLFTMSEINRLKKRNEPTKGNMIRLAHALPMMGFSRQWAYELEKKGDLKITRDEHGKAWVSKGEIAKNKKEVAK